MSGRGRPRVDHGADMIDVRAAVDAIRAGAQGVPVEQLAPLSDTAYEHAAFVDSPEVWAWDGGRPPAEPKGWWR